MLIEIFEGLDVTELLNIQKWERPMNAQLAGQCRGNFPSDIRKTEQERIQNLKKELSQWQEQNICWTIQEKLDGSSMTVYMKTFKDEEGNYQQDFGVCSRNIDLKEDEFNAFWKTANALNLREKLATLGIVNIALQGELVGEGIQGNKYNLKGVHFYLFDVFDIKGYYYWCPKNVETLAKNFCLNFVPIIERNAYLTNLTIDDILLQAEGKSMLNSNTEREGIVYKSYPQFREENFSFKSISNKFLMLEN